MLKFLILVFTLFFTLFFSQNNNDYYIKLDEEIKNTHENIQKLRTLYERENTAYNTTKEKKYLISSKYVQKFLYADQLNGYNFPEIRFKQMPILFNLLKTNNNESSFITAVCNYDLAMLFESYSPGISIKYLNEAIKIAEENKFTVRLPFFYCAKANRFYNDRNYNQALCYFTKALHHLPNDDYLYKSSMHNNLGLTYSKMKNYNKAIDETKMALKILDGHLTNEENIIFYKFAEVNIADYYIKIGRNTEALPIYENVFNFYKEKKRYDLIPAIVENFYNTYTQLGMEKEKSDFIGQLDDLEDQIPNYPDRIILLHTMLDHYIQQDQIKQIKSTDEKTHILTEKNNELVKQRTAKISDMINQYMITSINNEYKQEIKIQERRNICIILLGILIVVIMVIIIYTINNKRRNEKIIAQDHKKIAEQELLLKQEQIKNVNLSLNLKNQTEKAFLEKLKKIKRNKNVDAEEIIKELYFNISSLLQVGEKNEDFSKDISSETSLFCEKLSNLYPELTKQELNLCVYFKLDLTAKDIGVLVNITPETVRVYKSKIKAKMNLCKEQNMTQFLNNI
ncbi:hypothetical protein CLU96_4707 [Chryseobacterium sp. 52]|uniref:hypothetical protein n=1 Tax=Chryseobacterium sp. 52 TaxID=2035213 RepID=UPI000C19422E|nr:hypothetical protein [Chryseobacterium sp. 52]PIF47640.1 hypothetical protein CLU96_4707 [Chryseobacterium sp. 52]